MDTQLEEFIIANAGKMVWYATPAGLFQGISTISSDSNILTFDTGYYFSGNIRLRVEKANILKKEIIAWGKGVPIFNDKLG